MRSIRVCLVLAFLAAFGAAQAHAVSFNLLCTTPESPGDCAIIETQLSLEVTDPGGGQVQFVLANAGPDASSVARIYFDDDNGRLGTLASAVGCGTSFSTRGPGPGDLPGGVNFSADITLNAAAAPSKNGVNPGESLTILFDIASGTFADIIDDMTDGDETSASLRVGTHVISLASGGSEGTQSVVIPEPGTLALLAVGCTGLALAPVRRRGSI